MLNLLRWVSPRTLKETFVPPTRSAYPHQVLTPVRDAAPA